MSEVIHQWIKQQCRQKFGRPDAVNEAKITLRKTATIAEALVSTPKTRKMQASRAGYAGANQAVGPQES
jgi:hypothetical protein